MRRLLAIIVAFALLSPAPVFAQDDFAQFWKEFSTAAAKGDKDKIKSLTKFPIMFDGKDSGPEAFDRIWKALFTPKLRACLGKAKPVKNYQAEGYSAFSLKQIYGFERTPQGWRFSEFGYDHG